MAVGSAALADSLRDAIADFAASLSVEEPDPQPPSHRSFVITNLEDEACVRNIGLYLVALVVQVVSEDLEILGEAAPPDAGAWAAVKADVERLLGPSNDLNNDFRTTRRDPWIMEALTRLVLRVADTTTTGFPSGMLAVTRVTPSVTRSGLDLVGIYRECDGLDFLVGEVKATLDNLNGNLSECYDTLKQVSSGTRALEVRAHLQNLALALAGADRASVATMMYSSVPMLFPIASHGPAVSFDAGRKREKLRARLSTDPDRFRFVICPITGYADFFDGIADAMRTHVAELMA